MKELTLPADIESIDAAAEFLDELLTSVECPPRVLAKIHIALDELLSNIAHYAYDTPEGKVTLRADVQEGRMCLTFIDTGAPYNPLEREEPDVEAPLSQRPVGGLGIFLVRKIMDDVAYAYRDGQNILTITHYW